MSAYENTCSLLESIASNRLEASTYEECVTAIEDSKYYIDQLKLAKKELHVESKIIRNEYSEKSLRASSKSHGFMGLLLGKGVARTYKSLNKKGIGIAKNNKIRTYDKLKLSIDDMILQLKEGIRRFEEGKVRFKDSVPKTKASPSLKGDHLDQIEKLGKLRDQGLISEDEFQNKKTELLSRI